MTGTAALLAAEAPGVGTSSDGAPYIGDAVSIGGTAVGTFASASAGSAISVTVSGLSLAGAQANNYSQNPLVLSANITTKALTITGLTPNNKVYDATLGATFSGTANLLASEAAGAGTTADGKPYTGDAVSVTGSATGSFATINVASGVSVSVSVSGLSLAGAQSSNYALTLPTLAANITAKALSITGVVAADKSYDGTTAATLSGTAALLGSEAAGAGTSTMANPTPQIR